MTDTIAHELETLRPALLKFARLQLRNAAWAEDAVSETLLAALEKPDAFAGRAQPLTWLIGILKHKVIDQIRRQSRETRLADDADEDGSAALEQGRGEGRAQRGLGGGEPVAAAVQRVAGAVDADGTAVALEADDQQHGRMRGAGLGAILAVTTLAVTAFFGRTLLGHIEITFPDMSTGLLISCIGIFFLPVTSLSLFGPQCVQFLASRGTAPGKASGIVYGVSTLGNIAGVMLTAFALIPHFRVSTLLYLWLAVAIVSLASLVRLLRIPVSP